MFVFKPSQKRGNVDLALLTDNNKYIEYSIVFKQPHLTQWVAQRIRSLFEPYRIDSRTDIMVNDFLDEKHPLYLYFMLLRQHIGFKLSAITLDKAINRIHWFYTKKTATKSKLNFVWNRTIQNGACPWITKEIDYQVQNKGPSIARRIKIIRLAVFYIIIKNHLYMQVEKSRHKNDSINSTCV